MRACAVSAALVAVVMSGGLATPAFAQSKVPVYVVIEVEQMLDGEAFGRAVAATAPLPAGARYIARSNKLNARDGAAPPARLVIIQFETNEAAKAWTDSVKTIDEARLKFTKSRSFVVEGFAP